MLTLRSYQAAAVDALWGTLANADGNTLVVLPTGTGKSLCIAEFVRRALQGYPETRILVLTHSRELVSQNYSEMLAIWPDCPAGIHTASLRRRDIGKPVIFGSIQSIYKKAYQLQRIDLVIVDEAQSIPRSGDTMWRKFLGELLQINPYLRVVGLTATAYRLDSGMLHKGKGALFSSISYEYGVKDAIEGGYLVPPVSCPSSTQIDTSGVGVRGGEFIPGQLEARANDETTVSAIADEIVELGAERRGWIIFGCGVKHCLALRDAIQARGYSCEGVFATTPAKERTEAIERFRRQEIRSLVSVNALTVGFNAKHVDLVALARPTQSAGLYIQSVGRGLRLFEGKIDCLVADFGGNIARFGPVDAVKPPHEKDEVGGDMPLKECPECEALNPIAALTCVACGYEFPSHASLVSTKAAQLAVLSSQIKPQWVDVSAVTYRIHHKAGSPDSVCVVYACGLVQHRAWVCPAHQGYARQRAVQWWQRHAPGVAVPSSAAEFLAQSHALRQPSAIQVRPSGKYIEVVGEKL